METAKPAVKESKADKKARRAARVEKKGDVDNKPPPAQAQTESHKPEKPSSESAEKKVVTKAERRAIQEAQRKAKAEKQQVPAEIKLKTSPAAKATKSNEAAKKVDSGKKSTRATGFFSHLKPAKQTNFDKHIEYHPLVKQVGLQYKTGVICGSNARAVALLCVLKQVISDYETPKQQDMSRTLYDDCIKGIEEYLHRCRPLSVSMRSVLRAIRIHIHQNTESNEVQAKIDLRRALSKYYTLRIKEPSEKISEKAGEKIFNDDVILTYGHSSLILAVLKDAYNEKNKRFSVIVADARPGYEGREMARKLLAECPGLKVTYILINAISYAMPRVTRLLLGAHAVLANGYIMSRVGMSQTALVAKAYNLPVLVCCETYKFSDRMQTDSFVHNELGEVDSLLNVDGNRTPVQAYNLRYDFTPPEYVTALITESAIIPTTSAPVVLRVYQQDDL